MKNILLGLILFAGLIVLQNETLVAQSFELLKPETTSESLNGLPDDFEITSSPEIKNISNDTLKAKVSITPETLIMGHIFSFCDIGGCYMPSETYIESPSPFNLTAGETTVSNIHIYLHPQGNEGVSVLNVKFFNADDPDDAVSYKVTYNVGGVSVNEPQVFSFNIADVVPNPATDFVTINLGGKKIGLDKLSIFNINGQLIEQININNTNESISINTANYPNGYYMYNLLSGNKIERIGKFNISK